MKKFIASLFVALILPIFMISLVHGQKTNNITIALARNTITPAEENYTYAVPKALGYFAKDNLSVNILSTDGSTAAIQALVSGSADIAYASSANIAAAIDKGVKIKAFAGLTVEWPYYIGVKKDSEIKSIMDLKGKRVGVISLASASYSDLLANLRAVGLNETDVVVVPVGAGARAAAALKSNQVDAIDSYSDSFVIMEQNDVALNYLPRPEIMDKLFSVTMVTRQDIIDQHPEKLIAFTKAAYKGIIYTKLYPESALKLSLKEFPQLAGSNDIHSLEAINTGKAIMSALSYTIPKNNDDVQSWGQWLNISNERWDAILNFAYDAGLTRRKLNVNEIWDGRLMNKIYDFDVNHITELK